MKKFKDFILNCIHNITISFLILMCILAAIIVGCFKALMFLFSATLAFIVLIGFMAFLGVFFIIHKLKGKEK